MLSSRVPERVVGGLPTIRLPLYSFKNTVHLQLRDTAVRPRCENLSCTGIQVNPQVPPPTLCRHWTRKEEPSSGQCGGETRMCLRGRPPHAAVWGKVEGWAQCFRASQHPAPPLQWDSGRCRDADQSQQGCRVTGGSCGQSEDWNRCWGRGEEAAACMRGFIHLEKIYLSTSASQCVSVRFTLSEAPFHVLFHKLYPPFHISSSVPSSYSQSIYLSICHREFMLHKRTYHFIFLKRSYSVKIFIEVGS